MVLGALLVVGGCASTPGARPEENSIAGHEQMARQQETEAAAIADNCRRGVPPPGGACWTSTGNPTREMLKREAQHRQMAADHRAASQALRDAEQRACSGISAQDRDLSPFQHREDIEGVDLIDLPIGGKPVASAQRVSPFAFAQCPA
jgi:hypothetical protein